MNTVKAKESLVEMLWPSPSTIVFIATLIAIVVGRFFDGLADDPGVGWHLKTGKIIFETGIIPTTDPFLAFPLQAPWICDQWLGDYIFYGLYHAGGWPLVYGFVGASFVLSYFLLFLPYFKKLSPSLVGVPVGIFFAAKLATIQLLVRSTLFGIIFFGGTLLMLLFARRELLATGVLRAKYYVALAMLFLLWANIHPSFFLGFILFAIILFSFLIDKFIYGTFHEDRIYLQWIACGALCALVTLINPSGYHLHQSILELGSNSFFMNYHDEWRSVDFKTPAGEFTLLLLTIIAAGWYWGDKKQSSCQFLALFVFSALALRSVRLLPHLALVAVLPCADAIGSLWRSICSKVTAIGFLENSSFVRAERTSWFCSFAASLLVIGCIVQPFFFKTIPVPHESWGPYPKAFPYQALAYLDNQASEPKVILNDPDWGGFITWFSSVGHKPLFDDRNLLIGEARTKAWKQFHEKGDNAVAYVKEYAPHYVLLRKGSVAQRMLRLVNSYPLVHEDEIAVVFRVS